VEILSISKDGWVAAHVTPSGAMPYSTATLISQEYLQSLKWLSPEEIHDKLAPLFLPARQDDGVDAPSEQPAGSE
jgi:hypothetical protein